MKCIEHEEQLSALMDNELRDEEAKLLFGHLNICDACRDAFRSAQEFRLNLKEQVPPMAPAELDEKIMNLIPHTKRYIGDRKAVRIVVWKRRVSVPLPVAAIMALLLVLGSAALSYRLSETQKTQTQTIYITTLPAVEVYGPTP
jgi:anti-sigma factor RsiW